MNLRCRSHFAIKVHIMEKRQTKSRMRNRSSGRPQGQIPPFSESSFGNVMHFVALFRAFDILIDFSADDLSVLNAGL